MRRRIVERPFWIAEAVVSAVAFLALAVLVQASTEVTSVFVVFLACEAVLFTLAFLLARVLGGPGKVLLVGAVLGFLFAIVTSTSGEENTDECFICFTPEEALVLGLLVAFVLYPGWALGAGVGALARLRTRRSEQPIK